MSARDIAILCIVSICCIAALRRPWIGILCWTWLSVMNPHRFAWGVAYDAPLAASVAACSLLGLVMTKDRQSPFKGLPILCFFVFTVWLTLSWLLGLDPADDYAQWSKVIKINFMILVALALMRTRFQVMAYAWVAVASLALLGIKGGLFTIASGGSYHVWGPPGSFIEDNNEFALALIMTIPLLRFLQLQVEGKWMKRAMLAAMLLCAASSIGSQSRGALLAIVAMATLLWWRSQKKFGIGILLLSAGILLVAFMPEQWAGRMATIETYQEDNSAMGRISAWWNAWNLAFHYPTGVGFFAARPELFAIYSPYPDLVQAAHSIYFQTLGNHGFIGLFLFLLIGATTWASAAWLRREAICVPEARWAADLGSMAQVSMAGYAVGGAFLSLAYFDLPYISMSLVVLARSWVVARGWVTDPPPAEHKRWQVWLGLVPLPQKN